MKLILASVLTVGRHGRRIARLRIGRTRETFAVHEELL